ncbi:MAG TPA: hypothetical protein VKS82_14380 [Streptosporangiaceae bacterium]|nr:hypothetical protein [Streptosporangiaceae bacterium]
MIASKNSNPRNQRNNPYILDDIGVRLQHSTAGMLWRWRTELSLAITLALATWRLATAITLTATLAVLAGLAAALAATPPARRFITRRAWCVLARHRLQKLCWEARLHTRTGRLPLIVRITPTKVGERALVLCRAGICAEDFEAHIGELRAACYARDARVTRHTRWSQLVVIDIVRHDPLTAGRHIPSQVLQHHRPAPAQPVLTAGEEVS